MSTWPVGFRFAPTEEELVDHYLRRKLQGELEAFCLIPELYVYTREPPDLFITYNELSDIPSDGRECFFFCPPGDKILNNRRSNNRMTEFGYWKDTCKKRAIRSPVTSKLLGIRRIFVYYEGRQPKGCKTDIVMHQYHLNSEVSASKLSGPMAFVLCHIIGRKPKKARSAKASTSASLSTSSSPNDSGNGRAHEISAQASEEVTIPTENLDEMSISSVPDSNVPIIPQQAQTHEEHSLLYDSCRFIDGQSDECYATPYSSSNYISASLSTGSSPNDSGNGGAHEISAQESEEVTIQTENPNEMPISSMPGSNVPIIPQQTQMHEEQSSLYDSYQYIDGYSDECYATPYSSSDYTWASLSTSSPPNDSGNGRAHEISAQTSEEVTIQTENPNEMSISGMPDGNVPIIPQQAQMHEEQSSLYDRYRFVDGHSDECYARPYSPSDYIEILDLWNFG